MKTGISTASLFLREYNEDALTVLNQMQVQTAEVFLATYSEYTPAFGEVLKQKKGALDIHSLHVLNTQFEPQLFSRHGRALSDAYGYLTGALEVARLIGAKYYTFHGIARLNKESAPDNFDFIAQKTDKIIETCRGYGVTLCYENVAWAHYDRPGFYKQLKKRCKDIKGVLDIKQARRSGCDYTAYLNEMQGDIVTAHLSDFSAEGKIVLPGEGVFDFKKLFKQLKDCGFDGALIIEVYKDDYRDLTQLKRSYEYISELAYKIF